MIKKSNQSRRRPYGILTAAVFASAVLLGAPLACNSTPEFLGGSGPCADDSDCEGGFCDSEGTCESQCKGCGNPCESTLDCPVGQYCSSGDTCQQECEPGSGDAGCDGSRVCSVNGQCVAKSFDFGEGGAGGMSGDGDGDAGCIKEDITFEPQIPNVVLLIDQSGSMNAANFSAGDDYQGWDCDGGQQGWRWNVVRNVLLNPDSGVVKPLEKKVRFGLGLYTSSGGFDGGTCPQLDPGTLNVDFDTHAEMLDQFECSDIKGDTPTRESLTQTAEALAALDLEGPEVIVLATDGEPDNCTCPNWNNAAGPTCANNEDNQVMRGGELVSPAKAEQYDVVEEARRIKDELGIRIEVINVSNPDNDSLAAHLDNVALAGGAVSSASIDGFNASALAGAFQTIIDGVRSCTIDLDGTIKTGSESKGTVTLDGDKLEYKGDDGWVVDSPSQITLVGDACETIKTGEHDLDVDFPCGTFVVIPK